MLSWRSRIGCCSLLDESPGQIKHIRNLISDVTAAVLFSLYTEQSLILWGEQQVIVQFSLHIFGWDLHFYFFNRVLMQRAMAHGCTMRPTLYFNLSTICFTFTTNAHINFRSIFKMSSQKPSKQSLCICRSDANHFIRKQLAMMLFSTLSVCRLSDPSRAGSPCTTCSHTLSRDKYQLLSFARQALVGPFPAHDSPVSPPTCQELPGRASEGHNYPETLRGRGSHVEVQQPIQRVCFNGPPIGAYH